MRQKLLTQLFIFTLLFLTWWNTADLQSAIPTSGKISGPIPVFPALQVNLLKSQDLSLLQEALAETSKTILEYIIPELANEPWQAHHLFVDLLKSKESEVVITLALPPDRGILAVIQKQNNQYVLFYYLDSLLPLAKPEKLIMPGSTELLVTREDHNERMGAYTESREIKVWAWQENKLQLVWNEYSLWEMNWLNTWQHPDAKPVQWFKLIQDLSVTFHPSSCPQIRVEGEQIHYSAPATGEEILPPPYRFEPVSQRQVQAVFHWNEDWQRFVLDTGVLAAPGISRQKVAILKDMEAQLESLVLPEQRVLYQVINKKGQVFLVNKENIKPND